MQTSTVLVTRAVHSANVLKLPHIFTGAALNEVPISCHNPSKHRVRNHTNKTAQDQNDAHCRDAPRSNPTNKNNTMAPASSRVYTSCNRQVLSSTRFSTTSRRLVLHPRLHENPVVLPSHRKKLLTSFKSFGPFSSLPSADYQTWSTR